MEQRLRQFFQDAQKAQRVLDHPDTAYRRGVEKLLDALEVMGIERSKIDIDEIDLFKHHDLRTSLSAFVEQHPFEPLPLESITYVHHDVQFVADAVKTCRESMEDLASRYNIEIRVHVFGNAFPAGPVTWLAQCASTEAIDELGFFFDFDELDAEAHRTLLDDLKEWSAHPAMANGKVRVGNFPACFFAEGCFKQAYRDAIAPLKGAIGAQRDVIREVGKHAGPYHAPCVGCRARKACYTFSEIEKHPEYEPWLRPRTGDAVVFAGGSVEPYHVKNVVWTTPAEQGDFLAAIFEGFDHLLLVDGYFRSRFPVTTFEVMTAMEQGVRTYGAASMGALRAAELAAYGMTGVGYVFDLLSRSDIKPYHVVAQTYLENNRSLTPALVQLRFFIDCAVEQGVISSVQAEACIEGLEQQHFMDLSFKWLFAQHPQLEAFYQAGTYDVKQEDARLLIGRFRDLAEPRTYAEYREQAIRSLFARYSGDPDMSLPDSWRQTDTTMPCASLESRSCDPVITCKRAKQFFEGLNVVVADTTRYEKSGSHVLSTYLVPFYYLDYYPAAATGNGEDFDESLASAYMELVERAPASGKHIRERALDEWSEVPFHAEDLPQYQNWGMDAQVKQYVTDLHGYVKVSDLLAGKDWVIPKYATMFAYSGTDGYASGNTLPEAILYAIYEVIERDTCQMHVVDDDLRNALQDFQIDPSSLDAPARHLLEQARVRSLRLILFSLPNLFDLPCVMCHVYDEAQRVQSHGGIAVRVDFQAAAYSAMHEALMQYITYYAGSRDDYTPFAPMKQARIGYKNAQSMYFGETGGMPPLSEPKIRSLNDQLSLVLDRLVREGTKHVLVADTSPLAEYQLCSVKVIIPGLELWFVPNYQPSSGLSLRATELKNRLGVT